MTGDRGPALQAEARAELARQARAERKFAAADAHQRAANRLLGLPNEAGTLPELDDGSLMVFSAFNDPQGHRQRWETLPVPVLHDDPLRDPIFTKTQCLASEDREIMGASEDYSFFVIDDNDGLPILLVECDALGERYLGCREAGVELTPIRPDSPLLGAAQTLALRQLALITTWAGCPYCALEISADVPVPAPVAAHLGDPNALSVVLFRNGWIDLSQDLAVIEKGYRTLAGRGVRWGRRNMRVVSHHDPSIDTPALYAQVMAQAGRVGYWGAEALRAALAAGDVSAYVGFHDDLPVCVLLTSAHGATTYYMASGRVWGSKWPLNHIMIHTAIADAKARGQKRFSFGPLYDGGEFGAKLKSIAEFKAGFASSYERRLLIKMMG